MIPTHLFDMIPEACSEGLMLALASKADGAVMELKWCNRAFTKITGYTLSDVLDQRGTILIGPSMQQGKHLRIIEKLMNWEHFSINVINNRKDGTDYWHRMCWTPLTDPANGDRWWLCSFAKLDTLTEHAIKRQSPDSNAIDDTSAEVFLKKILRLEKENARLHELAKSVTRESNEDSLTGLSNRRHFEVEMKTWVSNLQSGDADFAVLYIDLDRFKFINDTFGHEAGDNLLVLVADKLRALTDEQDLVARLGGDEFVILKRLGDSALNISNLADEIVQQLAVPFSYEQKTTSCSTSVGVAIVTAKMDNPEQALGDADAALYHAKSNGRARWSFFTEEMHAEAIAAKELASDLLVACEQRQFVPFFQPLIDAATGQISSAEVLVRWQHPVKGLIPPDAFLETAANMGILKRIDEIVFSYLRETLTTLDSANVKLPRLAVNVSAGRLADPSFIHDIKSSGIHPDRLTIEILESVYLERMGDVVHWAIDELNEIGVTIAIDDFGTGHASIQGLLKIKPDVLKIDRQFVQPVVEDDNARALVSSIVGIGKSLGMGIVAEGVETADHAQLLCDLGCDYLQGYYFGKPMCAADLEKVLSKTKGKFWSPRQAAGNSFKQAFS